MYDLWVVIVSCRQANVFITNDFSLYAISHKKSNFPLLINIHDNNNNDSSGSYKKCSFIKSLQRQKLTKESTTAKKTSL